MLHNPESIRKLEEGFMIFLDLLHFISLTSFSDYCYVNCLFEVVFISYKVTWDYFLVGLRFRRKYLLLWPVIIFSLLVFLSQVAYLVIWAVGGYKQSVGDAWWLKLIGFMM